MRFFTRQLFFVFTQTISVRTLPPPLASYLIYKDENWALNGALGVSASYVADIAVPAREKEKEDDY